MSRRLWLTQYFGFVNFQFPKNTLLCFDVILNKPRVEKVVTGRFETWKKTNHLLHQSCWMSWDTFCCEFAKIDLDGNRNQRFEFIVKSFKPKDITACLDYPSLIFCPMNKRTSSSDIVSILSVIDCLLLSNSLSYSSSDSH